MSKSIKITCPYCDSKKISIWCLAVTYEGAAEYAVKCEDCGGHFDLKVKEYSQTDKEYSQTAFKKTTPEQLDHLWGDEVTNDD